MDTGAIIKWGGIALVAYLLYEQFTQGDLASTVGTTTTPAAGAGTTTTTTAATGTAATTTSASTPIATVARVSAVTPTINNALKATFLINGVQESIAVIPGGDAYDDNGNDITPQLAAVGVTPAQLYAIMNGAYQPATVSTGGMPPTNIPGRAATGRGVRGLNALADGPLVHMRPSTDGKWVM